MVKDLDRVFKTPTEPLNIRSGHEVIVIPESRVGEVQ